MNRSRILSGRVAGVVLALALVVPAGAQEFTESHIHAARDAIEAAHASEQFDRILPVLADQTKALFQRSNPAAVADIDSVVDEVALKLAARRPELDRELERLWAARLTEEELKGVTAFYSSPVGMKFGQLMPLIIQDSVRAANIWREALSTEIVTLAREELQERGHTF